MNWQMPTDEQYDILNGFDRSKCAACGGTGIIQYEGRIMPCIVDDCEAGKRKRDEAIALRRKNANVPAMYHAASLNDYHQLSAPQKKGKGVAAKATELFATEPGCWIPTAPLKASGAARNWLVLWGPVGTGKTHLACAAINHLVNRGVPCKYIRVDQLMSLVRDSYKSNDMTYHDIISIYQTYPVLLLDEMSHEQASDHSRRVMEDIIDARYGGQKATLITSNRGAKEFVDVWGERIASRLHGAAHWVVVGGQSLRQMPPMLGGDLDE